MHLALGAEGYLAADWNDESDGGFSALRRRIWDLEIGRAHTPWFHWGTTAMVAKTVRQFGPPELADEVLPGVLSGDIRLCLGYTEPEGGSDVATCKTRAVRDGDQLDHQRLQDVHVERAQRQIRLPADQHRSRTRRNTRT